MNRWVGTACCITGIITLVILAGCLGEGIEAGCAAVPDKDHCYQYAAVEQGNPDVCDKIVRDAPRSKCFVMIARDTTNKTICERITPGEGTYDKEDCYQLIALETKDVAYCNLISKEYHSSGNDLNNRGVSNEYCRKQIENTCSMIGDNCCWNCPFTYPLEPCGYCVGEKLSCNTTKGKCVGHS